MPIQKREFYEGAALHLFVRGASNVALRFDDPFFIVNDELLLYIKYSTKKRSPWGFTFMPREHEAILAQGRQCAVVIGLVCGGDGVVALPIASYRSVVDSPAGPAHIACYRKHGEHYQVNGPAGELLGKIPPSAWQRLGGT